MTLSVAPKDIHPARSRLFLGYGIFFFLGMGAMAVMQMIVVPGSRLANGTSGASVIRSGLRDSRSPGTKSSSGAGEFEYIAIPLEEPLDRLPDTSQSLGATKWVFPRYTPERLRGFIDSCDLPKEQRAALLDESLWSISDHGIVITPPVPVVLELGQASRQAIYSVLADSEDNSAYSDPFRFRPDSFDQWCSTTGLGPEQLTLLRKLTFMHGGSLCFADGPVLQQLFGPDDFKSLVRALYGERTFLMRLVIHPDSDINGIVRYWKKGGRAEALRPLLESMAKVPGGTSINVSYLLPRFARSRLYTFAQATAEKDCQAENCFWTAMNFFRESPDPRFSSPQYTSRILASEFNRTSETPVFGDLMLLVDVKGRPLHLCVYLTDDVVFTKNGGDTLQPWVLMKVPDMRAYYSAREPARMIVYRSRD